MFMPGQRPLLHTIRASAARYTQVIAERRRVSVAYITPPPPLSPRPAGRPFTHLRLRCTGERDLRRRRR